MSFRLASHNGDLQDGVMHYGGVCRLKRREYLGVKEHLACTELGAVNKAGVGRIRYEFGYLPCMRVWPATDRGISKHMGC